MRACLYLDKTSDELRRIHELYVTNDVIKNDTKFLGATTALLFDLLFLEFFDFVQSLDGFVHVRKDAIRAHVQCFLNVIRFTLKRNLSKLDKKVERTVGLMRKTLSKWSAKNSGRVKRL